MFARFFIERPIFAAVLSIFIALAGGLALLRLPVAQYPQITPPTVQVTALYPGANAEVVEQTVAAPIEEQVNGAEGMLYMSSTSSNTGEMTLTVTFDIGRDLDAAAVDVQNRVALAEPQLPGEVTRLGITIRKQSTNIVMIAALTSPQGTYDPLFMSNYAAIHLIDALGRVPGVGAVRVFGQGNYGMRVWLDPDRLAELQLTTADVAAALNQQNLQAAAGQIGQPPSPPGQQFQYTVRVKGRLSSVEEFEDIIVRAQPDGSLVHIRDVGRVELGSESYGSFSRLGGRSAAMIGVYQLPTANALDVVSQVGAALQELSASFPQGLTYEIPLDTTKFVRESIHEVIVTLAIAFALVFAVVYVFLQTWRATLIPALAAPVSLIGALAVFPLLGFSLNTLTLFGLVLAVGLVVDDAIVVVEAAQRHIDEEGLAPAEAARRAMAEVSGPVIAVALVLSAVFIPVAFIGGITGQLYQQFALTLAASVGISAFEALTLSPALCGLLLRPAQVRRSAVGAWLGRRRRGFERLTQRYTALAGRAIEHGLAMLAVLGLFSAALFGLLWLLPSSFVPPEDQGYFLVSVQLPDAASLERTSDVVRDAEGILRSLPGVEYTVSIGGFSVLGGAGSSNVASMFVILAPWGDRKGAGLSLESIRGRAQQRFAALPGAVILTFSPPAIPGLGATGGFVFELQNRVGASVGELSATAQRLIEAAQQRPQIASLFTPFRADVPQVQLDVDRPKVIALGVPLGDVFSTLQAYLSGQYVNDVNLFGRTYRVTIQAAAEYRSRVEDISRFFVRSGAGQMVPLGTLSSPHRIAGPDSVKRYNVYPAVELTGSAAPGASSGEAMTALEQTAAEVLPRGYAYEWTGLSYQEVTSRGEAPIALALAVLFVFLLLAALYESWSVPLAVILAVPFGIFGALLGTWLRGLQNDVYVQIGLVMVVGLAAKNAILIVEFAKVRYERGTPAVAAAVEAARIRFRPIVMTSLAFILGVLPLVVASGAGSGARHSLGTSVFAGMIAATVLGIVFVPVFFVLVEERLRGRARGRQTSRGGN